MNLNLKRESFKITFTSKTDVNDVCTNIEIDNIIKDLKNNQLSGEYQINKPFPMYDTDVHICIGYLLNKIKNLGAFNVIPSANNTVYGIVNTDNRKITIKEIIYYIEIERTYSLI